MTIEERMLELAKRAKAAGRAIACAKSAAKNAAILKVGELLAARKAEIKAANEKDLAAARASGMDEPKLDRLTLSEKVIEAMITACAEVAALSDPVGEIESMWQRPNGLMVGRMRTPLGVIAMIYESRPNVTIDAAILCLKAGNAVILRGGSEAFHSNAALADILREALTFAGIPADCAQVVPTTDRAAVKALCKLDEYIDVIIPRGGEGLIRAVVAEATMPVLKHYMGVCHAYADSPVDAAQAVNILLNAKAQRPGVCNALECLLVHAGSAAELLPMVAKTLGDAGVSFRACPRSLPLLGAKATAASDSDYGYEFHDLILAVKVVDSMDEALDHIARHSSSHTEVILTRDHERAMRFIREADSSMVGVNCSTRFNDGGELGLGAEIGISTSKLHAFGPMGVKELTSAKFVVLGTGQVRG